MNSENYQQIGAEPRGGYSREFMVGACTPTKRFPKIRFEFTYLSFFLIYLEFKRQIGPSTPEIPQKPYPNSDQTRRRPEALTRHVWV